MNNKLKKTILNKMSNLIKMKKSNIIKKRGKNPFIIDISTIEIKKLNFNEKYNSNFIFYQ